MIHKRNDLLILIHDFTIIFKGCIDTCMAQQGRYLNQRNFLLYQYGSIHMSKLVEAENEAILMEVENGT